MVFEPNPYADISMRQPTNRQRLDEIAVELAKQKGEEWHPNASHFRTLFCCAHVKTVSHLYVFFRLLILVVALVLTAYHSGQKISTSYTYQTHFHRHNTHIYHNISQSDDTSVILLEGDNSTDSMFDDNSTDLNHVFTASEEMYTVFVSPVESILADVNTFVHKRSGRGRVYILQPLIIYSIINALTLGWLFVGLNRGVYYWMLPQIVFMVFSLIVHASIIYRAVAYFIRWRFDAIVATQVFLPWIVDIYMVTVIIRAMLYFRRQTQIFGHAVGGHTMVPVYFTRSGQYNSEVNETDPDRIQIGFN